MPDVVPVSTEHRSSRQHRRELANGINDLIEAKLIGEDTLSVIDGVVAPRSVPGRAVLFVDRVDGDLKIIFPDGVTKTIVTD